MKKLFTMAAVAFTMYVQAQTTEKREIAAFTSIHASGAVTVVYEHSPTISLNVEGDAKEIKQIETYVEGGVLYLKTRKNSNFEHPFKIKVSGSILKTLTLSGASHFDATNLIKADAFTIEASGASRVSMPLNAKTVKMDLSGASRIDLKGNADALEAELSGASQLKAVELLSANATVNASGASTANIYASNKLSADCSGASSIHYKGNAKDVQKKVSGPSSIEQD